MTVVRGGRWRTDAWLLACYLLFGASGALAAAGSSPVLQVQGGRIITVAWSICGLLGCVTGIMGTLRDRPMWEVLGLTIGASASLTWAAALIMQAVDTHSRSPLTAACLALTSVMLIAQRWVDAVCDVRADRKE